MKDGTDIDSFGDVEVALLDKADISDLGTAAAKDSTNAVTAGSTDLVESGAVKSAIDSAVSKCYHHAGTKTVAQLTHDLLVAANEGNVYEMTDSGTTTSDFIEGMGRAIKEGDTVGIARVSEDVYKFDLLSGFVDTTNFVQKSQTEGLLQNNGTVDTTIQGTVNELESGLTTLDDEVNGSATTYPYAPVITINDAVPANLADCSVKVEPVQDLHGYDKPWVGGAGKNKLSLVLADIKTYNTDGTWTGNTYSKNGATFTVNTDSDGNVTSIVGTGNGNTGQTIGVEFTLKAGTYTMNSGFVEDNGSNDTLLVSNNTVIARGNSASPGQTFTIVEDALCIWYFRIATSKTITALPMIRLSTETDATFAPYTNICPITGHTESVVTRDGKNLFDKNNINSFNGYISTEHHCCWQDAGYKMCYIECKPNTEYTISKVAGKTFRVASSVNAPSNYEPFINTEANHTGTSVTITTGVNAKYLAVLYWSSVNGDTLTPAEIEATLQIEIGSSANDYEPFRGQTYTIQLGDTIYGGTVDFDSGVMTVTKTILGVNDFSFQSGTSAGGLHYAQATISPNTDTCISNMLETKGSNSSWNSETPCVNVSKTNSRCRVYVEETSGTDFATNYADLQVCYELATPTTVQLTPEQIQLLQGTNTLYASTGDISVTVNGVSGSIGAVQEQVNDHEERIETVESGLTNVSNAMGALALQIRTVNSTDKAVSEENIKADLLANTADITHKPCVFDIRYSSADVVAIGSRVNAGFGSWIVFDLTDIKFYAINNNSWTVTTISHT